VKCKRYKLQIALYSIGSLDFGSHASAVVELEQHTHTHTHTHRERAAGF